MNQVKTPLSLILLTLLVLSGTTSLSARADEAGQLQPETAVTDTADASAPPPAAPPEPMLQGKVHKSDHTPGLEGSAQSGQSDQSTPSAFDLAIKKLAAKAKLSTEDFRALGVGVVGYNADRQYFQSEEKVVTVYPGLPADQEGMKVGDIIIDNHVDDSNVKDPTRPMWLFSCGIAGQGVDITVHRGSKVLHLHLIEMNMEDIPDPKLRHQYEKFVEETGAPASNVEIKEPVSAATVLRRIGGLLGL